MNWNNCYSEGNLSGREPKKDSRSNFQKDYDRIIFSSAFRRLQNKTQVFPLPGTTFVHNRLTHSLEVASVGRSLGEMVGYKLIQEENLSEASKKFYAVDLSSVISSACLAHDIGNPAFGHSGEEAISNYFRENQQVTIEGRAMTERFSAEEWQDLTSFEGNANALRVLSQEFEGKSSYGMGLTITTLASILKYPCASNQRNKQSKHLKKYGYFQSEKKIFSDITSSLGMISEDFEGAYRRHPFVYLTEAADDICYNIIDMEDAHRIGIIRKEIVAGCFLDLINSLNVDGIEGNKVKSTFDRIGDANESISYLRAKSISALVSACTDEFILNKDSILVGSFNSSLAGEIEKKTGALKEIGEISYSKIYRHQSVLEIEVAGFHVMSELLDIFIPAVLKEKKSSLDKTIVDLIPDQFKMSIYSERPYLRVMNVLDHISGMTDEYATEMFRKLTGIEISKSK